MTAILENQSLESLCERVRELDLANQELRREIDERTRGEAALRQSEARYRELFENGSDLMCVHDLDGKLIETNLAFKKGYGFSEAELKDRNIADLIPERYQHRFKKYLDVINEKGEDEALLVIRNRDGRELIIEYRNKLVRDAEGRPVAIQGAGRDVTARMEAEKERQKLELQLVQMQRMEAIGTLAGGIAHNFNNLLMGIQGNAAMAALTLKGDDPLKQKMENILKLVDKGSKLTNQLLGYARGGKFEVAALDVNELIRNTAATFGETRKDIRIIQQLDEDLGGIEADQGQVEQVLFNLFVNAAEAMPSGGEIILTTRNVTHDDIRKQPHEVKKGDYVQFVVRDTGVGMDPQTIRHIFDPFYTSKGLASGIGLGLASVYGIVKSHGGYIDVDSAIGRGSTFVISLPAAERRGVPESSRAGQIVHGKANVLLVDDEELVLDVGRQMLQFLGYSVLLAKTGTEAIDIYRSHPDRIDLVILDMIMPEMSGGAVYDELVRIRKDTKVLLASGYSIDGQANEILGRGCDGFIQKPFSIKDLSVKIKEILDRGTKAETSGPLQSRIRNVILTNTIAERGGTGRHDGDFWPAVRRRSSSRTSRRRSLPTLDLGSMSLNSM